MAFLPALDTSIFLFLRNKLFELMQNIFARKPTEYLILAKTDQSYTIFSAAFSSAVKFFP